MKVETKAIVYQRETASGLAESRATFQSVEELSRLCLEPGAEGLPMRVVLDGVDDEGRPFALSLVFACTIRHPSRKSD